MSILRDVISATLNEIADAAWRGFKINEAEIFATSINLSRDRLFFIVAFHYDTTAAARASRNI